MIQLELCRYRWERRETGIGAELVRILREELLPLLPAGPSSLKRDFAAYVFAGLKEVVDDLALTPRAFSELDRLEQEVVAFTEILQVEKQEGVAQGMASMLVEYVDAVWGAGTGQRFRERLLALDRAAWPAMRDLLAASRAGRDPLDLLRAAARDAEGA